MPTKSSQLDDKNILKISTDLQCGLITKTF